ncbi:MAG: hypothetical protein JNM12_04140 [Alphaproteobacteria bacterium]|nr:hypothetical protein [Alphaproteobacteria bacterium]
MSLAEEFKNSKYGRKVNDFVLSVNYALTPDTSTSTYYQYDFMARILTTRTGGSDGGVVVTPFSQLDPESLENLRNRLIELGGKPPLLAPTLNKPPRGLNP